MYKENLKKLRIKLNLSAQKLADKLGSTQVSISNYETGKRKPSYEFLEALHKVYNVNLNWFVSGQGEMFIGQDKTTSGGITAEEAKALFDKWYSEKNTI